MVNKESKLYQLEKNLKKEEKILKEEIVKEEKGILWFFKSHSFKIILTIVLFILVNIMIISLSISYGKISVEKSEINAPTIILSSQSPGILDKVFVKEGDWVSSGMIVAQVNGVSIKAKVDGLIIFVQNTPGQVVSSQTSIVKMIQTEEFRVVGHLFEDKGLSEVKIGQKVMFTVDTFGSNKYVGVVDSIGQTSRDSAITFSISDKRPEKEFDVKVKYDVNLYPELKNGMSAKMWIYK